MAKATTKKLDSLHDLIATYYSDTIKIALEEGTELSSGTLAAINAFLKNNDIKADMLESSPLQNMTYRLQDILQREKKEASL